MLIHMKASQVDSMRDANVKPPENSFKPSENRIPLVTTMTTGNNIIIRIAMFDHSFAVASLIASIHPFFGPGNPARSRRRS
jgi:hypothetical protein